MKLDEVDKDQLEVLHKPLGRLEDAHLVRAAPATAICVSGRVLGCCRHTPMIPVRGTYVFAADAKLGLQLTGIFGYRLAGRIIRTSPAILRRAIARARPIMWQRMGSLRPTPAEGDVRTGSSCGC
jgi:hypothetical protein